MKPLRWGTIRRVGNEMVDVRLDGSAATLTGVAVSDQIDGSVLAAGQRVIVADIEGRLVVLQTSLGNVTQVVTTTPSGSTTTTTTTTTTVISSGSPLFVGREKGPHVGLFRLRDDKIFFQAVDTANRAFVSIGGVDYAINKTWMRLGYDGYPGIRLVAPDTTASNEQPRGVEVDAETLVGVIPGDVLGGSSLSDLGDVTLVGVTNGQVLAYNSSSGVWENTASVGAPTLDDLTDVNAPTPTDGDVLTWDDGASEWIASAGGSGSGCTSGATGTFEATDAFVTVENGCVVEITYKPGLVSQQQTAMVAGLLMGAAMADTVYGGA